MAEHAHALNLLQRQLVPPPFIVVVSGGLYSMLLSESTHPLTREPVAFIDVFPELLKWLVSPHRFAEFNYVSTLLFRIPMMFIQVDFKEH